MLLSRLLSACCLRVLQPILTSEHSNNLKHIQFESPPCKSFRRNAMWVWFPNSHTSSKCSNSVMELLEQLTKCPESEILGSTSSISASCVLLLTIIDNSLIIWKYIELIILKIFAFANRWSLKAADRCSCPLLPHPEYSQGGSPNWRDSFPASQCYTWFWWHNHDYLWSCRSKDIDSNPLWLYFL